VSASTPREGPRSGEDSLDARLELDRPSETELAEADGGNGNGSSAVAPVVRNASVRSSRETAAVPLSRLAEKVE
jgi:hypothetical protein